MNHGLIVVVLTALTGCSHYSRSETVSEVGAKGYTVPCSATPANQPDCYTPLPSWGMFWPSEKIHFELGKE